LAHIAAELSEVRSGEMNSIPSIEVSEQTEMYTYDWVFNIVQFIKSGAELLAVDELTPFVNDLLSKKIDILQRIAIHLIRLNYDKVGFLLWDWIGKNRLTGQFNVHELYLLIQQISPSLTIGELKLLVAWIEDMQYESAHYKLEDLERFKLHRIRTYLSAIKVKGKEQIEFMEQRNKYFDALDPWPLEHPEFDSYSTFSRGYDVPIQQNVLEAMTVTEQVNYLTTFEKKGDFDTEPYGLGLLLNNAIIGAPDKYEAALPELMKLKDFYLQQVISSFVWVIKNRELKDWKALINQLNDRLFAKGSLSRESKDFEQTLTSFAELLLQFSEHNDKFKFSINDLDELIGICVALLSVEFPDQLADIPNSDQISERLNSLWGKAFDAMIRFNRLWANHPGQQGAQKIHLVILSYLEEKLNNPATASPGFFINLGWHFPYLLTVATDWCQKNSSLIFPTDEYRLGLVVNNLLSPYQQVYKNVLVYLREAKLNPALVNRKYRDEASFNRICRYALTELNYIDNNAISEDGTLINLILEKGEPDQYKSIITVALQNKEANEAVMLELWTDMTARISGEESGFETAQTLIAGLLMVSGISDESLNLLDKAIGHLQNVPVTYQILSTLYKKFEFAPERISQTVLKIWEQAKLRVMITDDLENMVEKLYAQGLKPVADEICLYVAGQGNYELKAIYDQCQTDEIASKKSNG